MLPRFGRHSSNMTKRFKVLFCGEEFEYGCKYTAAALRSDEDVEVADHISTAHVAVPLGAKLDRAVLGKADNLRLVIQYGVGLEGVDMPAATEKGVFVSNIPSAHTGNALSCAEHAIYLTLAQLRNVPAMNASLRQRRLGVPIGQTLYGKSILLVGFGSIARELVPRLKAFGVRLAAARRRPWGEDEADLAVEGLLDAVGHWQDLPLLASSADIIVLCCSLNEQTRGLVNAQFLARCKDGVQIINVARGGLLDYDATVAGLDSGKIGGLGLDVQWKEPFDPSDPLSSHPRVTLTPHIAGVTELSYRAMADVLAAEVRKCKQGLPPTIQVNSV